MLMRPSVLSKETPLPLWQSPVFAKALRKLNIDADVVPLGVSGQVMIVRRKFGPIGPIRFASRGPVWAPETCDADKVQAIRQSGLHALNAEDTPRQILKSAGFRQIKRAAQVLTLDVQPDLGSQVRACRGKWRNAYQQGVRLNPTTRHAAYQDATDRWLFSADRAQQKAKGYRALPSSIVKAIAAVDQNAVMVSQVMQGPTPIAAMLFLVHSNVATYHIGVTTDAGRMMNAHHVLLMQATRKLARRGVREIELGLHQPDTTPGLSRFKRGSGARIKQLGGTWIKVPFL